MSLPPVPENLENIVVVREFLARLREAVMVGLETDPIFLSQKGQPGGVPVLDFSSPPLIPTSEMGTGVADGTKFLRGDRTWAAGGGGGSGDIKSDGTVPFAANESMGGFKLTNVGTPTAGTDAANKDYVDNNEKYAATFIVNATVGRGTHTTIEAAVAAAPAEGADIYVYGGTWAPVGTIVLPLDRSIRIRGAGAVGITIITIPTGVPLFSVAGGSTAEYSFSGFKVVGDSSVQSLIDITSSVNFYFDDVETESCRTIISTTVQPTAVFTNCEFNSMPGNVFSYWNGTSGGKLVWNYVTSSHGNGSAFAVVGNPEWIITTGYIGGPSYSVYALGHVVWHNLRLDLASVTIADPDSKIDACEFQNVGITVTSDGFICDSSLFFGADPTSTFQLKLSGDQNAITGCLFQGGAARGIDILSTSIDNVVSGCRFFSYVLEGLRTASSNLVASGNTGLEVVETGAANNNRYTGNTGFSTSTIIGLDSVVEGVRRKDVVGEATTDAFVDQFTHTNTKGMTGCGSIKNTGVTNTMTVLITAIDAFGVTDTATFDIMPSSGASYTMTDATGTALPPFVSYKVGVKSTLAGNPTTFTLYHATTGAY